ncbi:MAG: hypothetical protein O7F12_05420 [Nitrospirae bacterium]|nr:hypothetical protein [Nitrospirota bacterium]
MSDEKIRYALGGSGQLYKFTGKDLPAGADPLIEEDGTTLTATGNQYCKTRGIGFPNAEVLRVLCDQYSSATLTMAASAHDLNLDLMPQRQDKTKEMSERLRLDWEKQDKAYKESQAAKKISAG